jgi:5-oxoprolinase (ATP-hydrolysing)
VADALGMTRVFIHPFAGVLSAYGMGLADVRELRERAVEARLFITELNIKKNLIKCMRGIIWWMNLDIK